MLVVVSQVNSCVAAKIDLVNEGACEFPKTKNHSV